MPGLVRISYRNVSGVAIPPFGSIQFKGAPQVTGTGDLVIPAVLPGNGTGPIMIDDGKGTSATGAGSYGTCVRAYDGFAWAAFNPAGTPPPAWGAIGPATNKPYMDKSGSGYMFSGQFDSINKRVLVIKGDFGLKPYVITEVISSSSSPAIRAVGIGENVAVDSDFVTSNNPVVTAKAYTAPESSIFLGSSSLDDVPVSYIDVRAIMGVIFTGQMVLVADAGQHNPLIASAFTPVGDVVSGPTATEFVGTVTTAVNFTVTNGYYVDIPYAPRIFPPSTTTRNSCRVLAFNATGIALANGQTVIVDHVGNDNSGNSLNRWRISEVVCS